MVNFTKFPTISVNLRRPQTISIKFTMGPEVLHYKRTLKTKAADFLRYRKSQKAPTVTWLQSQGNSHRKFFRLFKNSKLWVIYQYMGASLSLGQWLVHFSTADSSCLEVGETKTGRGIRLLRDKSFQCKKRDVVVRLWHPHPPLMYMLDIIGWLPSREQTANPLVYAAKSWKVLTRQLLGGSRKMEKHFGWKENFIWIPRD